MVKLYFPLALLLGHVPLKAGWCDRKSIWLFDPHRGQGTRTGFFCFFFTVSKVQEQKAKTTVRVGSDRAFTNYSVPLESGPASGAYRGSLL